MKTADMVGLRFGAWLVLAVTQTGKKARVLCRCDCGVERDVLAASLNAGVSTRCRGCGDRSTAPRGVRKHGHAATKAVTPEYRAWKGMKGRCADKANPRYGGRGIAVCARWKDSFDRFLADMGPRPSPTHSIDRIDNSKGYDPTNCRWATPTEQNRNKSNIVMVTIGGESQCLKDWCRDLGVSYAAVTSRMSRGLSALGALAAMLDAGQMFVVTHDQQVASACDARVRVAGGAVSVS